jgi:hypothetical protein
MEIWRVANPIILEGDARRRASTFFSGARRWRNG